MKQLKTKDASVNIWGLQVEMQPVLKQAGEIWENFIGVDLTVTSGRDGIHSLGSLHYYGYAVDLRTWDSEGQQIDNDLRHEVVKVLKIVLSEISQYYDVINHSTHIHVEYDAVRAGLIK